MFKCIYSSQLSRSLAGLVGLAICSAPAKLLAQGAPDFGPNVVIVSPAMPADQLAAALNSLAGHTQFDTARSAVLFLPGTYSVQAPVGFYESIAGVGTDPSQVTINGFLTPNFGTTQQYYPGTNITDTFWRSLENLSVNPATNSSQNAAANTLQWGVSQGAPLRRMQINGGLELTDTYCGEASGGFMADVNVTGNVNACSQQQWYTRNSAIGSFTDYVWNFVFSGVTGTPAQNTASMPANTVLPSTPVVREKPFLYVDGSGNWSVFVPAVRQSSTGVSWSASSMGSGYSVPLSNFLIAQPSTSLDTINNALASGKNLILTPGIYQYSGAVHVVTPNTVILGLGYATLVPQTGTAALAVEDVDGVQVAGIMVDAGPQRSPVLFQVGNPGAPRASHAANPTSISDVFMRVGGATGGSANVAMEIDSDDVIIDDAWLWRADHGSDAAQIGWTQNVGNNGLIVNGDNVTALGLAVEHFQQTQVQWNGDGGETVFYQSELPYDVPDQAAWRNGSANGFASYNVAGSVLTHRAYGLGVYSFFNQNHDIVEDSAITVPDTPGVAVNTSLSVFLSGSGSITHVINQAGSAVSSSTGATPSYVSFYGGQACATDCAAVPQAPTQLTATVSAASQISLTWTGSTSPVLYSVFRSTASGFSPSPANQIASGLSSASFVDTNLPASTSFFYRVEASSGAQVSAPSNQASATTTSASACNQSPATPFSLAVEGTSATQNALTWGAAAGPANCNVTYTVYRSVSGSISDATQVATDVAASSYTDASLTNAGQYFYSVVATDAFGSSDRTAWVQSQSLANWTLVWGDDFNEGPNGTYPSSSLWNPEVVNNTGQNPFGDGTIMSTTASNQNAYLDGNGNLVIAMTYDSASNTYNSARLISAAPVGPYGRIEARIKNPYAPGIGSAFWALGNDYYSKNLPWPQCGELDIMESQALNPGHTASTIHGLETDNANFYEYTGFSQPVDLPNGEQLQQAFHTYTVQWSPYHIQYSLDGAPYGDVQLNNLTAADVWELNRSINFILSSGVGGNGGTPTGQGFPANLTVDYVHYYQWAAGAPSPATNLAVSSVYSNAVTLSWTGSPSAGATYDIYAGTTSGFSPGAATLVAAGVSGTTYQHTGLQPGTTYYYTVVAANWGGESAAANATATTLAPGNSAAVQLSAGGYAAGTYMASAFVAGGNLNYHSHNPVNTSQVTNPAPQAVYDVERWGPATWTIPGLAPGAAYTVRLHFVEPTYTAPGMRQFNVAINGQPVLTNFDIFGAAGAPNTAITQSFSTNADAQGNVIIATSAGTSGTQDTNPSIEALEITPVVAPTPSTPASTGTGAGSGTGGSTGTGAGSGTDSTSANGDVLAIAVGQGAVSGTNWLADQDFTGGGKLWTTTDSVDTSDVVNPAPESVYQSERSGALTYTLPGLTPGASYMVRLHFAEVYFKQPGQRIFNVAINGTSVLANFDIVEAAGGPDKAIVEQFAAVANGNGQIVISFTDGSIDHPKIDGIELVRNTISLRANGPDIPGTSWISDAAYTNNPGKLWTGTTVVDLSTTAEPAPQSVYQAERSGAMTYAIPGLTPNRSYTVLLHFAEIYFTQPNQRVFNVSLNGTPVLTNFDIVQAAGGSQKALVESFSVPADPNGNLIIGLTQGSVDYPKISGIQVF